MKRIRCLIIGFPHSEIQGNPLETFYGIRVRDWALFTQLQYYGIDADLYVQPNAIIDDKIAAEYGSRFIRDPGKVIADCNSDKYDCVILSATKLQAIYSQLPFLSKISSTDLFGAFCYDNEPAAICQDIASRLIGVTFTSPLHKRHWDNRGLNIPSILITTGQLPKPNADNAGDGSVLFMGYIHSAGHLHKLALMADADKGRPYHVVSSFIREIGSATKKYYNMSKLDDQQRNVYFRNYVIQIAGFFPDNLQYHFLPPGQEYNLMNSVSVGIDFSWMVNQSLENSKICHYLTYGIAPVAQLPAPSFRYVNRFRFGQIVPFNASVAQWTEAIHACVEQGCIEERNRVRRESGYAFDWSNVTFDIGSFLIDYYLQGRSNQ